MLFKEYYDLNFFNNNNKKIFKDIHYYKKNLL